MTQNPHKIHAASCKMSGHVSYSAQQLAFYGMIDRRINKRAAAINAGLIVPVQARNPLRAEKTPRKPEDGCFDYSIPEGRKDLKDWHKWDYPEVDFGIMGKFASQKEVYSNYIGTLEDYKSNVAKANEERARAAQEAEEEKRRTLEGRSQYSSRTQQSTARESEVSQRTSRPAESALEGHAIKTFKVLGGPHPEILENWRAKRAAEFIKKLHNPLDPPPKKAVEHPRPMLPSGAFHEEGFDYGDTKSPQKAKGKRPKVLGGLVSHAKVKDINSMKASLADLMSALDSTEQELERQKLALALNTRKKAGYEGPASGRAKGSRAGSASNLMRSP